MTSKLFLAAFSAGLLFGAAHGALAADAPKAPKISTPVLKPLQAAQAANNKKDFPAALAAIEQAKAVSDRTPYDNYMIHRFAMAVHLGMNDMAGADTEIEAAIDPDPSLVAPEDKAQIYKTALQLAASQKHADKALTYAKLLANTTPPPDPATQGMIVMAYYSAGDYAGATAMAQKNVDAAIAAGRKPERNDLDVIMGAQVKQKDEGGAEKTLEILVATYNTQEDWDQLSGVALTTKGMRDIDYVYMGRLILLQAGKVKASDASLVGSAANSNKLGLYGDAQAMQKFGGPAPDPRAAADQKSLPKQIADASLPKNDGEYSIKTAEAAYGYGQYADAEKLARAAKTKPGVKDPSEPDMVIGMSLAAQGKYAEAVPVFDSIKPSSPATARVVRLWSYFVKSKANPATAAAK